MIYVLRDAEPIERALRQFKKRVQRAGIFADLRAHKYFQTPSEKLRKKRQLAASRRAKAARLAARRPS